MVVTVFRSRLREDHAHEFRVLADRMLALAKTMPGFVSYKSFTSEDGERCSIIEFESLPHLRAWREHPEHREAQRLGRERFYAEYSLHVAEPDHETHFEHEPGPPSGMGPGGPDRHLAEADDRKIEEPLRPTRRR